jgi:hypothetical protein
LEHAKVTALLQEAVRRVKLAAFAMGYHERLGAGSLIATLPTDVTRMISELV